MFQSIQGASALTFQFQSHEVRTVIREGEPWFVAADVCAALGYRNTSKAIGDHLDADEKGITTGYTLGGDQKLTIINESGLYSLVLRSRKPEARKFAKWITSEVLPSIRKTGKYSQEEGGPSLSNTRWQLNIYPEGHTSLTAIPDGAMIITRGQLLEYVQQAVSDPMFSTDFVQKLGIACLHRLDKEVERWKGETNRAYSIVREQNSKLRGYSVK